MKEHLGRAYWAEASLAGCISLNFYLSLPFFKLFEGDGWIPFLLVISQMIFELHWIIFFPLSFVSFSHIVKH